MLISIHWIHCILLPIQLHRSWLPWKFLLFFRSALKKIVQKEPAAQTHSNLWCDSPSRFNWSLHISTKFCGLLWIRAAPFSLWYSPHEELGDEKLCPSVIPTISWFLVVWLTNFLKATNTSVARTEPFTEIPTPHRKPPVQWKHCISFSRFLYFAHLLLYRNPAFVSVLTFWDSHRLPSWLLPLIVSFFKLHLNQCIHKVPSEAMESCSLARCLRLLRVCWTHPMLAFFLRSFFPL